MPFYSLILKTTPFQTGCQVHHGFAVLVGDFVLFLNLRLVNPNANVNCHLDFDLVMKP